METKAYSTLVEDIESALSEIGVTLDAAEDFAAVEYFTHNGYCEEPVFFMSIYDNQGYDADWVINFYAE